MNHTITNASDVAIKVRGNISKPTIVAAMEAGCRELIGHHNGRNRNGQDETD